MSRTLRVCIFNPADHAGETTLPLARLACLLARTPHVDLEVIDLADGLTVRLLREQQLPFTLREHTEGARHSISPDALLLCILPHLKLMGRVLFLSTRTRLVFWATHPFDASRLFPTSNLFFGADSDTRRRLSKVLHPRFRRRVSAFFDAAASAGGLWVIDQQSLEGIDFSFGTSLPSVVPLFTEAGSWRWSPPEGPLAWKTHSEEAAVATVLALLESCRFDAEALEVSGVLQLDVLGAGVERAKSLIHRTKALSRSRPPVGAQNTDTSRSPPPSGAVARPASTGRGRPLVTVIFFCFRQERFVAESLRSVLAQDYSPLEIIVSDDASPDGTWAVVEAELAAYRGPHTIIRNRNPTNLGIGKHYNKVMDLVRGDFVVQAAGDDVSVPHRTSRLVQAWEDTGRAAVGVFTNCTVIDAKGVAQFVSGAPPDESLSLDFLATRFTGVHGATYGFDRRTWTTFGPLDPEIKAEDLAMPFRACLLDGLRYIHEPLVKYRTHDTNMSYRSVAQASPTEFLRDSRLRTAGGLTAMLRTRLADLRLQRAREPARLSQWLRLEEATRLLMRDNDLETEFWQSEGFDEASVLAQAVLAGTPSRRVLRWLGSRHLPSIYLDNRELWQRVSVKLRR